MAGLNDVLNKYGLSDYSDNSVKPATSNLRESLSKYGLDSNYESSSRTSTILDDLNNRYNDMYLKKPTFDFTPVESTPIPVVKKQTFGDTVNLFGSSLMSGVSSMLNSLQPTVFFDNAYSLFDNALKNGQALSRQIYDRPMYSPYDRRAKVTAKDTKKPIADPQAFTKAVTETRKAFGVKDITTTNLKPGYIKSTLDDWNNGINHTNATNQKVINYYQDKTDELSKKVNYATKIVSQVVNVLPDVALMMASGGLAQTSFMARLPKIMNLYNASTVSRSIAQEIDDKGNISKGNMDYAIY
jgi:hypothetical protein